MKRKASFTRENNEPAKKFKPSTNEPLKSSILMQIFSEVYFFSEFISEIENIFPNHKFEFDQVTEKFKNSLFLVYPKENTKLAEEKNFKLLVPKIQEFSTQEIIYKVIYDTLNSPSSSLFSKNVVSYGFRIQTENQSKKNY